VYVVKVISFTDEAGSEILWCQVIIIQYTTMVDFGTKKF
jgi:hypothetical protein